MKVIAKMMYLGFETKVSKKGSSYLMVKFMEQETTSIFEFYVPSDKLNLVTCIGQLKPVTNVKTTLNISSYSSKAQVDLEGVEV